jgi:beta-aspartyl-peptidase (threonine type)
MERTQHVLLGGPGANQFALEMGVETADDAYFFTQHRYEQMLRAREEGVVELDHTPGEQKILEEVVEASPKDTATSAVADGLLRSDSDAAVRESKPMGTVGAVACDSDGNLAAATSTGGMTNKKFGRIGDTPLIGSGTYADNASCAVSCTGHGEFFMLGVTAYDVAARMKYKEIALEAAARETVEYLTSIGGEGGLIAVDATGNIVLPFNSEGMYRGFVSADGGLSVEIYR